MPVFSLGPKEEVVDVVPPRVELDGVAEHHEDGKTNTGDRHEDAVGVAVEDVGAEVLAEREVTRNPNREVSAERNGVCNANNVIQTFASVLRAEFVEHSEQLQDKYMLWRRGIAK